MAPTVPSVSPFHRERMRANAVPVRTARQQTGRLPTRKRSHSHDAFVHLVRSARDPIGGVLTRSELTSFDRKNKRIPPATAESERNH
jgi:hypothetical protein